MPSNPKIKVDLKQVEQLGALQCTDAETAAVLGISESTWFRRKREKKYREAYERGQAKGKMSLRRALFKNAIENMNTTAQIWLSKQILGMRDKHDVSLDTIDELIAAELARLATGSKAGSTAAAAGKARGTGKKKSA